MTYQVSSKSGRRHVIDGPMPTNDQALAMLMGRDLPVALCGREIEPVNFYGPDDPGPLRFTCAQCATRNATPKISTGVTVTIGDLITLAGSLLGPSDDNAESCPEYERALSELIADASGVAKEYVLEAITATRH